MIESEREILGCYFADPSLVARDIGQYFTTASLRAVYEAIIDLLEAGEPINAVTVAEHLEPNLPGATKRIAEVIEYPAYTKPKFLDREANDCLYRMKAEFYRNQIGAKCKDPLYDLEDIKADLAGISIRKEIHVGQTVADGLVALEGDLSRTDAVACGFAPIDERVGGFRRGELVTFMARPTVGKTFVLLNIVHHLRASNFRLGFFSLEMPLSAVAERMMQIHDEKYWRSITLTYLQYNDHSPFIEAYKNTSIHTRMYSVPEISRIVEDEKSDAVFIDFLGLIKPSREFKSPYERVSATFIELKAMAKERNVVVFLASQLSRLGGDGTQPVTLDSARDSGQVEELSDFIVGCWRPQLNSVDPTERKKMVMALKKNKRGDTVTRFFTLEPTGRILESDEGKTLYEKDQAHE